MAEGVLGRVTRPSPPLRRPALSNTHPAPPAAQRHRCSTALTLCPSTPRPRALRPPVFCALSWELLRRLLAALPAAAAGPAGQEGAQVRRRRPGQDEDKGLFLSAPGPPSPASPRPSAPLSPPTALPSPPAPQAPALPVIVLSLAGGAGADAAIKVGGGLCACARGGEGKGGGGWGGGGPWGPSAHSAPFLLVRVPRPLRQPHRIDTALPAAADGPPSPPPPPLTGAPGGRSRGLAARHPRRRRRAVGGVAGGGARGGGG